MELKYLIPDRFIPVLIDRMAVYTQPDPFLLQEGKGRTSYFVTSLYFDSIDLHSLQEKEAGLLARRKVRLRTYEETFTEKSRSFIEIKRRHDFVVSKDRLLLKDTRLHSTVPMSQLLGDILQHVDASEAVTAEVQALRSWYNLQPTALVQYRRTPFVGMQDRKFRITIDSDLQGAWKPMSLFGPQILTPSHPGWSVVELKCNHFVAAWFHEIIQDLQFVRVSHSKYALVVESMRERLTSESLLNKTA